MSRILVIGGYGGFGARLSRRLAAAGHIVLVGGRSEAKARAFCNGLAGGEPARIDRDGDVAEVLARMRPDLVVDAAGPFQGSGYGVVRACITARLPYVDLADARGFVVGMAALDKEARAAGVAVVSGASSVPALSGAAARALAEGLERIDAVEIAISASSRASAGASVVSAILSYIGRPVRLWRGGRWTHGYGWQKMRREDFLLADGSGPRRRLVAIAEVPDLSLLPPLLPGRPAVTFRAGTELGFQMRALWLASWPVRWGWIGSLRGAARVLGTLYRMTLGLGGETSAMGVVLSGRGPGGPVERRWTLVAERGDGLEVPTLAAARAVEEILAGRVNPGVADPAALFSLQDFAPALEGLAIRCDTDERPLPPPLYARLLGPAFAALPPALRRIHEVHGDAGAAGEGQVARGKGLLARLIGAAMRMPRPGPWPLHVTFRERGGVETWTRDFGGQRFSSELSARGDLVVERFGPLRFAFALPAGPGGLEMRLRGWSVLRLPLPLTLAPRIEAREWEEEERFRFDVRVAVPLAGEVVRYSGWLR